VKGMYIIQARQVE